MRVRVASKSRAARNRSARVGAGAVTLSLLGGILASGAVPAWGRVDTAPTMSALEVSPSAVNPAVSAQTIEVRATLNDDRFGFDSEPGIAVVTFDNPDGDGADVTAIFDADDRVFGNDLDGDYETTVTVPADAPLGTWPVVNVEVHDSAGNTRTYDSAEELAGADLDTGFEVDNLVRVPAAPLDVTAAAGDGLATVSWSVPRRDGGAALTAYSVKAFDGATLVTEVSVAVPATSTTVTGLANGTAYSFEVAATNAAGAGDPSERSGAVVPTDMAAPSVTELSVDPDQIDTSAADAAVRVTARIVDIGSGFAPANARVTFSGPAGDPGASKSVTADFGPSSLVSGTAHDGVHQIDVIVPRFSPQGTWTLSALALVDVAGNETVLSAADLADLGLAAGFEQIGVGDITPPTLEAFSLTPGQVDVTAASQVVTVTARVADAGAGAANPAAAVTLASPSRASTVLVQLGAARRISGTAADGTYEATVTIPQGSETGWWTAEVRVADAAENFVTLDATALAAAGSSGGLQVDVAGVPAAPTGVQAIPGPGAADLSWTAPTDNGGSAITGYVVTAMSGSTVATTVTTTGPATSVSVSGLTNGTSYTFTVRAVNLAGAGAASDASEAVTPATKPGNPTGVTATAGDTQAALSWTAPASDGGAPITGYTLTVREGSGVVRTSTLDGPGTSATVSGLTNNRSYRFSVAAVNRAGSSSAVLSNPVTPQATASSTGVSSTSTTHPSTPVVEPARAGYWMVGADGRIYRFGAAAAYGEPTAALGAQKAADLEPTVSGLGYWVVDAAGRVYAYGDAGWFGNVPTGILMAGERVTSLSRTRSGRGYWIFTTRGQALSYGDAVFYGDMSKAALNGPVLDSIPTATGQGYYMVGSDGGIFAFGDAKFRGSMGGRALNASVQSLVPDHDGSGYWLVASDGGVFAFDAPFRGSMGAAHLNRPITGMVPFGTGYLMVGEDGGIFNFSGREFLGSLGSTPPASPIVAVAVLEN